MATEPRWTMDELVARVASALSDPEYPGAPNGRVRDVPDRRAVRWYSTIGLVDRPAEMQGRKALYGTRHFLQIIAIKRRQASGASLAEIQAELVGATDKTLRTIADLPDPPGAGQSSQDSVTESLRAPGASRRDRFWAERPAVGGDADSVTTLTVLRLPGTALVLSVEPDHADIEAIRAAARPLLDLLADRGLLIDDEGNR